MKVAWNRRKLAGALAIALGSVLVARAIDYPMFRGGPSRSGVTQSADVENPGRGFLRWWDPTRGVTTQIDNWETGASWNPNANWFSPNGQTLAFDYTNAQPVVGRPEYAYAYSTPVDLPGSLTTPRSGVVSTFDWSFAATNGQEYALYVNIPQGPTEVTDSGAPAGAGLYYSPQYYVYEITGVQNPDNPGQPIYDVVDTYISGNDCRLGNGGLQTDRLFVASGGTIRIRLYNTIIYRGDALSDTRTNLLHYADSARIVRNVDGAGTITASPVVGTVNDAKYPFRVMQARNEETTVQVGSTIRSYSFGILNNYWHNGYKINPAEQGNGGEIRRNLIYSWPAKRPVDATEAERTRYAQEKRNWIAGTDIGNQSRADQTIQLDNLSAQVQVSLGWSPDTALPGFKGEDYQIIGGSATDTARVFYRPRLPAANYRVYVWVPQTDNTYAATATVKLYQGAFLVGVGIVDMRNGNGWKQITIQNPTGGVTSLFTSSDGAPLTAAITNEVGPDDIGNFVVADAMKFVRDADLSITSTPAFKQVPINVGGTTLNRDAVFVAHENGRIYALNAAGTDGGAVGPGSTSRYWAWPSELPDASDPNKVAAIDGKDGIAEYPTGYGLTSPLVANVGGRELLFVGSKNGRVYCLDTQGRGDGTTTRVWTWPNDYPSATPSTLDVGAITGSLSYDAASQTLYVPTVTGRVYALDAAGNGDFTTSLKWQYPASASAPLGAISMTPAVSGGRVYFGDAGGTFFALRTTDSDANGTGDVLWSTTGPASLSFGGFNASSPAVVPASEMDGGMPTTVFLAAQNGVYAYDAAAGTVIWQTNELGAQAIGSLAFTRMNTFRINGAREYNPLAPPTPRGRPVVLVPTLDGRLNGLFAVQADVNKDSTGPVDAGKRLAWGYALDGRVPTSPAFAGIQNSGYTPPIPQLDEDFAYMVVSDDTGNLYAFGDEPELSDSDQGLTPGTPPGQQIEVPNDPTVDVLRYISLNSKVQLVLPEDYETLSEMLRGGTLPTRAQVLAMANKVTRLRYEYGETLYAVVYDLPDPVANAVTYQILVEFTTPNAPTQRRYATLYRINEGDTLRNYIGMTPVLLQTSGTSALAPGKGTFRVAATANTRAGSGQSTSANLSIVNSNIQPGTEIYLAHPIGISRIPNPPLGDGQAKSFGVTLDVNASNEITRNGMRIDGTTNSKVLIQNFASDNDDFYDDVLDFVPHGQAAQSAIYLFDRSLMALVNGVGLQNIRYRGQDLYWKWNGANKGIYKQLDKAIYAGFEDEPGPERQNTSLDYPDIRRENLSVTKEPDGRSQNPAFQTVGLVTPSYTPAQLDSYKQTSAQYNQYLQRSLLPTTFYLELDTPRFQPPNGFGYMGEQFFYVDPNGLPNIVLGDNASVVNRYYTARADVSADEQMSVRTPVVDLGSTPAGALYGTENPLTNPILFTDPRFASSANPVSQTFDVYNEGNVNLLNVRMAKGKEGVYGTDQLFGTKLADSFWLDRGLHLHSDLDPAYTPVAYNRKRILQKARVGDGTATRLRLTPVRRGNPNLGIGDTGYPDVLDPRVTVSTPIGTPVGDFSQSITVFEDSDLVSATAPILKRGRTTLTNPNGSPDVYEANYDKGFVLKFRVGATRLTTRETRKAAPMIDALGLGGEPTLKWANQTPGAYRDPFGNLVVAFASNRLTNGNTPGWIPRTPSDVEVAREGSTYLYFATLNGDAPNNSATTRNSDLERWTANSLTQWFRQQGGAYPNDTPTNVFGYLNGDAIAPGSERYGLATFPTNSVYDPLETLANRGSNPATYMAFVGQGQRLRSNGIASTESRLFIAPVATGASGDITVGNAVPLAFNGAPVDPEATFGRPSLVQTRNRATVFYPVTANGTTQINWAHWNGNQWVAYPRTLVGSLAFGNSFETITSISAVLHATGQNGTPVITVAFSGKLRGQSTSDVYLANLNCDANGMPQLTGNPRSYIIPWETRLEVLERDTKSDVFWSAGAAFLGTNADIDGVPTGVIANPLAGGLRFVDVMRRVNGGFESVLDHNKKFWDGNGQQLTVATRYGGEAIINFATGSVRMSGALLPTSAKLYLRCTPRVTRVSESSLANYRGVSMIYDDRYQSDLNFCAPESYTFNNSVTGPNAAGATVDRLILSYLRSPQEREPNPTIRYRTLRFGVRLLDPPTTTGRGIRNLSVNGLVAGSYYQVDPVRGNVYVGAVNMGRTITVTYTFGTFNNQQTRTEALAVGYIGESEETQVPVENGINESPAQLALDPMHTPFSSPSRLRPGLIWMIWSSNRAGTPDIYMQTMAPKFVTDPQTNPTN